MNYTLITGATGGLGGEFCRQLVVTDNLFLTGRNGLFNRLSACLFLRFTCGPRRYDLYP